MKFLFGFAAAQLMLQTASACAGIMPDHHMLRIMNSPDVPDEVKQRANFTYMRTQELRAQREYMVVPASGEGITPGLDDNEFDEEQDPAYAAHIAQERAAMQHAQDTDIPVPGAVEDQEGPEPTGTIEKRWQAPRRYESVRRRQVSGPFPFVGVWTDNHDCNTIPADTLVRSTSNNGPVADDDAETAFGHVADITRFFGNVYGRNSINGTGGGVWTTIHYCDRFSNAIWDGVQMLFGDGDGYAYVSRGYVRSTSIIAHEFTHGVIQYENPLFYSGMSGALNEHLADVFGSLAIQYFNGQSANAATWLIGNGIVVGGGALRNMQYPGTAYNNAVIGQDNQPGNMAEYYNGADDNYGVHRNSGIPNRAFVLFAKAIAGNSWERAGRIWYNVLLRYQGNFNYRGETFQSFAQRTINEAEILYDSSVVNSLTAAWRTVGVI